MDGFTVGILLAGAASSTPSRSVLENIQDGRRTETKRHGRSLQDAIGNKMELAASPDADYDTLTRRDGQTAVESIDHRGRLGSRPLSSSMAMDAHAPARRANADGRACSPVARRRRVALCKTLLQPARPAAPRRADEPPRRRERRSGSNTTCRRLPRAPSSRSRTTATSSTTSPSGSSNSTAAAGYPFSRATTRAGWSRSTSGMTGRREAGIGPEEGSSSASSSGRAWLPKARMSKNKARLAAIE